MRIIKIFLVFVLYLSTFSFVFGDVFNIENTDNLSEYYGCSSSQSGNFRKYQYLGQGLQGVLTQVDIKVLTPLPTYYGKAVGMEIYESDLYLENFYDITNSNLVWRQGIDWNTLITISGYNGIVSFYTPSTGLSYNFLPIKHYYLVPRFYTTDGGGICQSSYLYGSINSDSYKQGEFYSDSFIKDIYFKLYGLNIVEPLSGYSNVLFIPGLESSRLYWKGVLSGENENQLWEPNRNADVEKLYLDENGESIYDGIYTRDIIDETNTPLSMGMAGQNIYKTFSKTMNELVYEDKINRWEAYPYDWRQSVDDIVNNGTSHETGTLSVTAVLESLAETSKNGKVAIIAHSNGGLIAKALLKKLQDDKLAGRNNLIDKVDVLILVAVPQIGTASAIPAILHGYDQAKIGGLLMTKTNARELGRNMFSAYGLLPSEKYIDLVDFSPIKFEDTFLPSGITTNYINSYGFDIDSYAEYINFLKGNEGRTQPAISDLLSPIKLSGSILSNAESLHNKIDEWIPPIGLRVVEVAGWGLDTVASFKYKPSDKCVSNDGVGVCQRVLDEVPIFTVDGDKTVVEPSAIYMSGVEKYWVNIPINNIGLNKNRDHASILEVMKLNALILSIIKRDEVVYNDVVTNTKPISISNRLRLSVHSPITLGVYDNEGNFTGKICPETSDFCYIQDEIPNSSYIEFGEGKYLNLPEENFQKVVMQGTGIGTFTFESEKVFPEDTSTSTRFVDIPVTPQTIAEITINPTTQNSELKIDTNSDGISDITIQPNNEFDPIVYLKVMRKTIEDLSITKLRKNLLLKRIDDTIKAIEKGKINKVKLKIESFKKFMVVNSNLLDKLEGKKWFEKRKDRYLTREEIEQIITMLDTLLSNLNK